MYPLRRLLLVVVLLAPISTFGVRVTSATFPHTVAFDPDNQHWILIMCHFVNPSPVPQTITVIYDKRFQPAGNTVNNSPVIRETIATNVRLNQYESYYVHNNFGKKYAITDLPVKMSVEVAEETGFMMGSCAFTANRETDAHGSQSAPIRGAIPINFNAGRPF